MNWNVVSHLIEHCGFENQRALARAVGLRESAICDWREKNLIPARRQRELILAGRALGLCVTPDDFFPPELRPVTAPLEASQ